MFSTQACARRQSLRRSALSARSRRSGTIAPPARLCRRRAGFGNDGSGCIRGECRRLGCGPACGSEALLDFTSVVLLAGRHCSDGQSMVMVLLWAGLPAGGHGHGVNIRRVDACKASRVVMRRTKLASYSDGSGARQAIGAKYANRLAIGINTTGWAARSVERKAALAIDHGRNIKSPKCTAQDAPG